MGAFCKAYPVEKAIEKYLKDIYKPATEKNRYTYAKGTTYGGLIVYENGDFAYSHHSSNPAAGKLLNSFGLVRIHLFDEAEGTPLIIRNKFNPVINYLNSINWDGSTRLESLFIDYLGAEDSEYIRTVTRKTLTAAVARIFEPGIKYDYMPVLIGAQGIGKSNILDKLGGLWFSDSLTTVAGKEAYEQLQEW